jgi:hypothetical protein
MHSSPTLKWVLCVLGAFASTSPFGAEAWGEGHGWGIVDRVDFNADGMTDVLWSDQGTNRFSIWLMAGTQVVASGPILSGPGADWQATFACDFNHDGMSDVVFSNERKNLLSVWLMNGTRVLASGPEISGPAGAGWSVSGCGDFNADGMSDALWKSENPPRMAVWLMSGTSLLAAGPTIRGMDRQ